jgi:hypothetical protein
MNAKILVVALVAGASLVGCKTMEGSSVVAGPAAESVQSGSKYLPRIEEDAAYISYVETVARRRGIAVHWVRKPVKRYADRE